MAISDLNMIGLSYDSQFVYRKVTSDFEIFIINKLALGL